MGNSRAFTLVELLVVVLIIGVLAAVALPQYQMAVWTSRYSTIKSLVRTIANAEEVYYLANGNYTADVSQLDIDFPVPDSSSVTTKQGNYFFPWGTCIIMGGGWVTCILNKDGERFISYEKKLNYTVMSGRTLCITHNAAALAEDSLAKRICRKETKKKSCANDTWQNVPYCSYGY